VTEDGAILAVREAGQVRVLDIGIDLANPNGGNSWRLDIGTPAS
jgi:hypothetical protein